MANKLIFVFGVMLFGQAVPHERLPLGDRKISDKPKRGFVMACQKNFPGGGGAHRVGGWISEGNWDPQGKPIVEGEVPWPQAHLVISVEAGRRVVHSNGLPNHPTGEFPIREGSTAYQYDRNPNRIGTQTLILSLPLNPQFGEKPECVPMGLIGVSASGVAIFNAFDLAGRDAPSYEIQDRCNGHPEVSQEYHYHHWSPCLIRNDPLAPVGWMLDGFPILGPVDQEGKLFANADLDECHGMIGPVRIDGKIAVTYHYRFTREYPYTVGCFRGAISR